MRNALNPNYYNFFLSGTVHGHFSSSSAGITQYSFQDPPHPHYNDLHTACSYGMDIKWYYQGHSSECIEYNSQCNYQTLRSKPALLASLRATTPRTKFHTQPKPNL